MTPVEALDELGWSWTDFARHIRVHRNTAMKWRSRGLPGYAKSYLALALSARLVVDEMNRLRVDLHDALEG